jgi:inhibitor of KinA sporulation pathway (predicted exonuclease)
MVDIEADGPIPGDYSMIEIGAVVVDIAKQDLNKRFSANLRPISEKFLPEALAVSGYTHEQTLAFDDPEKVMSAFAEWIRRESPERPMFISDNNGYDWMFTCWYFHHFLGKNPFGHSSTNLGSFYKGVERSFSKNFKGLRQTRHSHKAVEDAAGNAEAFLTIISKFGVKA